MPSPIIPKDYSADAPFLPITDIDKIDKDDFAPVAGFSGRARVGTWLRFSGVNGQVDKPAAATEVPFAAAPTWSDYDSSGAAGHPDAYRLGQLTLLVGPHRGKTQYYLRDGANLVDGASVGKLLSVYPAQAADVAAMTAGYGEAISEAGDGLLQEASSQTTPAVALCLRGPDSAGYIQYLKY